MVDGVRTYFMAGSTVVSGPASNIGEPHVVSAAEAGGLQVRAAAVKTVVNGPALCALFTTMPAANTNFGGLPVSGSSSECEEEHNEKQ